MDSRARIAVLIVLMILVTIAVIAADFAFGAIFGGGATPVPTASSAGTPAQVGSAVQSRDGSWMNVGANQLVDLSGASTAA
jgi:hypothetical protein